MKAFSDNTVAHLRNLKPRKLVSFNVNNSDVNKNKIHCYFTISFDRILFSNVTINVFL